MREVGYGRANTNSQIRADFSERNIDFRDSGEIQSLRPLIFPGCRVYGGFYSSMANVKPRSLVRNYCREGLCPPHDVRPLIEKEGEVPVATGLPGN